MNLYVGEGIVRKPSDDTCALSAILEGNLENLYFTRRVFYTFGYPCEGSLANILEEGMKVNFRYRISSGKPKIIVVWLGEEPDVPCHDLGAVFSQSGRVSHILNDSYIIQSGNMSAVVSKDIVYRDGSPNIIALVAEDHIMFDAVPLKHDSGVTYQATCAWIGTDPKLMNRFRLDMRQPFETIEIPERRSITGTVVVIPNDAVAFVEVEEFCKKVMLFRSSFEEKCERIGDIVHIGDRIGMIRSSVSIGGDRNLWFATEAWKDDEELQKKVLYRDPPLQGVLSKSSSKPVILYRSNQSVIVLERKNFYLGGNLCKENCQFESLVKCGNMAVKFEGVISKHQPKQEGPPKRFYEATCAWVGEKPSLGTVAAALPHPPVNNCLQYEAVTFCGTVSRLYLPDKAVVSIAGMNRIACLHVDSFLSDVKDVSSPLICDFVRLGDYLSMKLIADSVCDIPVRAVDVRIITKTEMKESVLTAKTQNHQLLVPPTKLMCEREEIVVGYPPVCDDVSVPTSTKGFIAYKENEIESENIISEHEGTGIITRAAEPFCLISANINGRLVNLPFDEEIMYMSGTDVLGSVQSLHVGMQVKFTYVLESQMNPCIVAVWVEAKGRKTVAADTTKVLYSNPPLQGVIASEDQGGVPYLQYGDCYVYVKMTDFYDDGRKCTGRNHFEELTKPGRAVNFEAVPMVRPDLNVPAALSDMKFTHKAVCVWVGKKPNLKTFASSLPWPGISLPDSIGFFRGTVSKLYLPNVALVVTVPGNKTVCVYSSSFHPDTKRFNSNNEIITDFVGLGDCLKFRLGVGRISRSFARAVNISIISETEIRERLKVAKPALQITPENQPNVLFGNPPLSGVISSFNDKTAVLSYKKFKVLVKHCDFYLNGAECTLKKFTSVVTLKSVLSFEAIRYETLIGDEQISFYATCAWIGDKPSLPLIASCAGLQGPQIAATILSYADRIFLGKITKVCLPDLALIEVKLGIKVTVVDLHISAFSDVKKGQHITDFVQYQGYVQFKVRDSDCLFGICASHVEVLTEAEFDFYCKSLNRWQMVSDVRWK